jgi:hypothetical protein
MNTADIAPLSFTTLLLLLPPLLLISLRENSTRDT